MLGLALLVLLLVPDMAWADGWYLLVPPRSEYDERANYLSGYKILSSEPLSKWGQQGAYDSASECEAVRNSLLLTEQRVYASSSDAYIKAVAVEKSAPALKIQRYLVEGQNANVWALMASRCIRSDDPRLATGVNPPRPPAK